MWLGWILFLELFGHHAVVSAETCILETNDLCDWKDVKDVNDITSEAIVAFYTAGMNNVTFFQSPCACAANALSAGLSPGSKKRLEAQAKIGTLLVLCDAAGIG